MEMSGKKIISIIFIIGAICTCPVSIADKAMLPEITEYFSESYFEARDKFLDGASKNGGRLKRYKCPTDDQGG